VQQVKLWLVALALALVACGGAKPKKDDTGRAIVQTGKASWYGGSFHGGPTASGETYNKHSMTAAHKKLRFNTRVRVTNLKNGRTVIVRINNRGPYSKGRIIDLSEAAARKLDMIEAGVVPVRVEVLR
jgi:rare lipoprotein A